jgi:hypothetical protein
VTAKTASSAAAGKEPKREEGGESEEEEDGRLSSATMRASSIFLPVQLRSCEHEEGVRGAR